MQTVSIGFSTCPNDTFIFDAMIHGKIDTKGLNFELVMGDVEELNKMALNSELDITKLSYHAYAHLWQQYQILDAGSALGRNNGPILISKKKIYPDEVNDIKIAIPGKHTTANLLLSIAYPKAKQKIEYLFSDIEEAIASNEVDAGLIIHETRFTYPKNGFKKIIDLGEFWEQEVNAPIPLGGIVVKRNLDAELKQNINNIIKNSLEFAYQNPQEPVKFMKQYAQEMAEDIMQQHINLYVNQFSLDLGKEGKRSIDTLYKKAFELKQIPQLPKDIFV